MVKFDSYVASTVETANSVPLECPPYSSKGLGRLFKKFNLKKKGFTLAETLITLAIIGVIAALTIPTLISKYQKHTYVVGLKKAYSELQNAVKMIPISEGCPAGDLECAIMQPNQQGKYYINGDKLAEALSKQLKVAKIKGESEGVSHFAQTYTLQLDDGRILEIVGPGDSVTAVIVNVNGYKGPNKYGRDQFAFYIAEENKNGIQAGTLIPYGSKL